MALQNKSCDQIYQYLFSLTSIKVVCKFLGNTLVSEWPSWYLILWWQQRKEIQWDESVFY